MTEIFKKLSVFLMAAAFCLTSVCSFAASVNNVNYDGSQSISLASGSVMGAAVTKVNSENSGKSAADTFYSVSYPKTGTAYIANCKDNPGDLFISVDFRFTSNLNDQIIFSVKPYYYENSQWKSDKSFNLITISSTGWRGVTPNYNDNCSGIVNYKKDHTLLTNIAINEWHTAALKLCCKEQNAKFWFDGTEYEIDLIQNWKTYNENPHNIMRYGFSGASVSAYSQTVGGTVELDNILVTGGYDGTDSTDARSKDFILEEHDCPTDGNYLTLPTVTYAGSAVSGNDINTLPQLSCEEVLKNVSVTGCGTPVIYEDSSCKTAIAKSEIVPDNAVLVVPVADNQGIERIYKKYSLNYDYSQLYDFNKQTGAITGFKIEESKAKELYNNKKLLIPEKIGDSTVKEIGNYAFCTQDRKTTYPDIDFVIPDIDIKIGTFAFFNSGITELTLGVSGDAYVDYQSFQSCSKLSKLTLGEKFQGVKSQAFYNCNSLKSVDVSKGLNTYGPFTGGFQNCSGLEEIKIGQINNKAYIPENFVAGCKNLKSIIISDTTKVSAAIFAAAYDSTGALCDLNVPVKENEADLHSTLTIPEGNKVMIIQLESKNKLVPYIKAMQVK